MMQLSERAISSLHKHSPDIKLRLALALGCSEATINRYIRENDDNLTKAAALKIIREITGLKDNKILVKRPKPS